MPRSLNPAIDHSRIEFGNDDGNRRVSPGQAAGVDDRTPCIGRALGLRRQLLVGLRQKGQRNLREVEGLGVLHRKLMARNRLEFTRLRVQGQRRNFAGRESTRAHAFQQCFANRSSRSQDCNIEPPCHTRSQIKSRSLAPETLQGMKCPCFVSDLRHGLTRPGPSGIGNLGGTGRWRPKNPIPKKIEK